MGRVTHFEFPADDPGRAIRFYHTVFGWTFRKWEGPQDYWRISTGDASRPGIDGGMVRRSTPVTATVNTIEVESLAETLERVQAGGGQVLSERIELPGAGGFAYCQDSEGNVLGVLERAPRGP